MKLIVGAGPHYKKTPGKEKQEVTLDIRKFKNIDIVHDLNHDWPEDMHGQFLHISALHVVEHLNDLIHFMDQAWLCLKKGGSMYIETPLAGGDSDLEFCDPTHIRCYRPYTFTNYFTPEGIEQFGYTDKPWAILKNEVKMSVICVHLTPIHP